MLELVRELEPTRSDQERALYRRGEEFIMVSTVGSVISAEAGMDSRAIVNLVGAFAGYPTSGEETMAFVSDEDGEPLSWTEIASATGPGSRESVLEELEEG